MNFQHLQYIFVLHSSKQLPIRLSCYSGTKQLPIRLSCSSGTKQLPMRLSCYSGTKQLPIRLSCYLGTKQLPIRLSCYLGTKQLPIRLSCYSGTKQLPIRLSCYSGTKQPPIRLSCYLFLFDINFMYINTMRNRKSSSYRVTGLYRLGKTYYLHTLLCSNSIIAQFPVQNDIISIFTWENDNTANSHATSNT